MIRHLTSTFALKKIKINLYLYFLFSVSNMEERNMARIMHICLLTRF